MDREHGMRLIEGDPRPGEPCRDHAVAGRLDYVDPPPAVDDGLPTRHEPAPAEDPELAARGRPADAELVRHDGRPPRAQGQQRDDPQPERIREKGDPGTVMSRHPVMVATGGYLPLNRATTLNSRWSSAGSCSD